MFVIFGLVLKCIDIALSTGLCADSLREHTAFTEAERKDGSGGTGDGSNEEGRKERRTREVMGANNDLQG